MTPEERAKAILSPLTQISNHPSSAFNPRSFEAMPNSITFDQMAILIAEQIRQAQQQAYEECAKICDERVDEAKILSFDPANKDAMIEFYEAEECAESIRQAKDKL